jgi:hypothetical protein
MTERDDSVSADAQAVLDWLKQSIAETGGRGRRPGKIQMGLNWWDDDEERLGPAVLELKDRGLVTLENIDGLPGMGPWICPR